jgi:hypothetical protein
MPRTPTRLLTAVTAASLALAAVAVAAPGVASAVSRDRRQLAADVETLAADATAGRDNGTAGSAIARQYLVGELKELGAIGGNPAAGGDGAFLQPIPGGANVVGIVPGGALAHEYVVVGAHYDHLGSSCIMKVPGDTICNGATDNATGVAAVLSIGRDLARRPHPPRRSVVLAFWDREEDGLLGSGFFVQQPLVPLGDTVAYVNYDIQGANLLPTLRRTTFAIGAETGGRRLTSMVRRAARTSALRPKLVSAIFGQGRSDYVHFVGAQVPTVFFSDSTGPCYHTTQDEIDVVDFRKLERQARIGHRLVEQLVNGGRPAFAAGSPLATFADAVAIREVVHTAEPDLGRFSAADQATLLQFRDDLDAIVAAGAASFGADDVGTLLAGAATSVELLTRGPCDGFLRAGR